MSYFDQKLGDLANNYGHLTGTLIYNTLHSLKTHDAFHAVGNILSCKRIVGEILDSIESIRKHCKIIDGISGSNHLQAVDRLRDILHNRTRNTFDLAMKHTTRKEYDSSIKLIEEISNEISKQTDDVLKLIDLKESFDRRKLPLDYLEFFETGEISFIRRIFLSYSMKEENERLIKDLIAPFLEELGFQTVYAGRDFLPTKTPGQSAEEFVKKSGTLIAFLTKDQDSYPSANVIHEIGVASDKVVIMFAETGTHVPSNLKTSGTYYTFERQHLEKMLLKLLNSLRLSRVYKEPMK